MGFLIISSTVDALVKGPFATDFWYNGRSLSVPKCSPAIGMCEISGLEYYLAKRTTF